jgi:hypothetical protein
MPTTRAWIRKHILPLHGLNRNRKQLESTPTCLLGLFDVATTAIHKEATRALITRVYERNDGFLPNAPARAVIFAKELKGRQKIPVTPSAFKDCCILFQQMQVEACSQEPQGTITCGHTYCAALDNSTLNIVEAKSFPVKHLTLSFRNARRNLVVSSLYNTIVSKLAKP